MKLLFLFCLATIVLSKNTRFRCYKCNDCTHSNLIPELCDPWVTGCVTVRTNRSRVDRDCYTQTRIDQGCTISNMANNTCTYCDDFHGCNMAKPDALICRSCDWTTSGTCEVQRVCRSPFFTESPMCYILYLYPNGFYFGCFDELSNALEDLQSKDPFEITHRYCDSHDCNWHAKEFWPDWEHMMDPYRICKVCFKDSAYCGVKQCRMDHVYSRFCIRSRDKKHTKCLSDIEELEFTRLLKDTQDILCTADNCNANDTMKPYRCGDGNIEDYVTRPDDGCVAFRMPNKTYSLMGRNSHHRCTDGKRCRICHSDLCTDLIAAKKRSVCYHTTGVHGVYIRHNQVDFMDMCVEVAHICSFQLHSDGSVTRGCAHKDTPQVDGLQLCDTDLCNRQMGGIYCYTCMPTDPNCVFSQHEGPFELCRPPKHLGCFTLIYSDSSVERGCASKTSDNTTIGGTYIFCNEASLCNEETTKHHACHYLQLNVAFEPTSFVPAEFWQKPTQLGWAFEGCRDMQGLPPCYMKHDTRVRTYGCTRDLIAYDLVTYMRGTNIHNLNFCDGHYCNVLPDAMDPRLRDLE